MFCEMLDRENQTRCDLQSLVLGKDQWWTVGDVFIAFMQCNKPFFLSIWLFAFATSDEHVMA